MSVSRYLFVSCSSSDKPRLAPLMHALLQRGFELWIDNPYDTQLSRHPGVHRLSASQSWQRALTEAIEAAGGVIVFWSKDSVRTERSILHQEAAFALLQGNLIQVRIDDVVLPGRFAVQQAFDLTSLLTKLQGSAEPVAALLGDPTFEELVNHAAKLIDDTSVRTIRRSIEASADSVQPLGKTLNAKADLNVSRDYRIFLNYRRSDCGWPAISLHGRLTQTFGEDSVFLDLHGIQAGDEYAEVLESTVRNCNVFLALIGSSWLDARDRSNLRRLDDPKDWVRLEIATALSVRARVIPILVDGADTLRAEELSEDIRGLAGRQYIAVDRDRFGHDMLVLVECLKRNRDARSRLTAI